MVHQPVSRGLAVFADACSCRVGLRRSAPTYGKTVAHQRWCFTTMRYINPRLYFTFTFKPSRVGNAAEFVNYSSRKDNFVAEKRGLQSCCLHVSMLLLSVKPTEFDLYKLSSYNLLLPYLDLFTPVTIQYNTIQFIE